MSRKSFRPTSPRLVFALLCAGMYVQVALIFGVVIGVAAWVAQAMFSLVIGWHAPWAVAVGAAGGVAFVAAVWTLPLLIVLLCTVLRLRVIPGTHDAASINATAWMTYNFYIVLVRYTLMNFIRATPLQPWFYRLLGAKIGKGLQCNSVIIGDCNMLTFGDYCVIGGDATVIAHSYERGRLVVAPVVVGHRVDIGLNAVIMPGVTIGDHAVVAAGSIVTKNTHIPANTVWAGVPAKQIRDRNQSEHVL